MGEIEYSLCDWENVVEHYPIHLSSENYKELLVFKTKPIVEIRFKDKTITIEKLIVLLEKIEYNGE